MGTFKDQFREFQSLGPVFMAGDIPVSVDYTEFNEKTEGAAETTLPQENALTSNDFKAKREKIAGVISKVQLDENVQAESDPEKEAKAAIKAHMEKAFSLIEHNYETRLQLVGRGPENTKAMEARNLLNQAADDFIFKMEMFAIQQNIQGFKVEENGAMVERGSTEQGKLLAKCALIDNFTKVPGFGKYLVESNPDILNQLFEGEVPKNSKEFQEKLTSILDNEGVLEEAIKNMIGKTPKFQEASPQEIDEINHLVTASQELARTQKDPKLSLTYMLGTENEQTLKDTLARRFRINFVEGTNNVDTYVDLMDGNRLYKPGTEFNKKLLSICNSDLGSPRKLEGHQKLIATREEAQADLHGELLSGKFWSSDMEVTGLSTLKNNPKLNQLIASAQKYENAASVEGRQINDALAQLTGMSAAPDGVSQETRAMVDALRGGGETGTNYVKSHPALREGGLKFFVALIQAMMGNPKALDEIYKGVNDKENPAETMRGFNDLLEKKIAKPQDALTWHGATLPASLTEGLEPKMKEQLAKYPELRAEAVRAYIGKKLGVKVNAISPEGLVTLKKGDNEFKVQLEISNQTFIAKQIIGEGAGKPIDASKWDTVQAFVAQLSLTAVPVAEVAAPTVEATPEDPILAQHREMLNRMVGKPKDLQRIAEAMVAANPELKKDAPVYKNVKNGQRLVNEARVAWIMDKAYPQFKALVEKTTKPKVLAKLLAQFKQPEAVATAPAQEELQRPDLVAPPHPDVTATRTEPEQHVVPPADEQVVATAPVEPVRPVVPPPAEQVVATTPVEPVRPTVESNPEQIREKVNGLMAKVPRQTLQFSYSSSRGGVNENGTAQAIARQLNAFTRLDLKVQDIKEGGLIAIANAAPSQQSNKQIDVVLDLTLDANRTKIQEMITHKLT